jgi:4-hydroxybenzoyl-CoA thioesterase
MINDLVEAWVGDVLGVPYAELVGRRRTGMPTVSLYCEFTAISRLLDDVMPACRDRAFPIRKNDKAHR